MKSGLRDVGMKDEDRYWNWGLIVIGLGFLAFGVISFITDTIGTYAIRTATAEGTVVGEKFHSTDEGRIRLPVVAFVTGGGQSIEFTSNTGGRGDEIGDSVTVRYDPAQPTNAKIYSFFHIWNGAIFWTVVGGIMIFIGFRQLRSRDTGGLEPNTSRKRYG